MYRRIYGSQGIPRHMWGVLHINTKRQASRLCPPLVPVSALSMNAAAACGLSAGIPLAEAINITDTSSAGGASLVIVDNILQRTLLASSTMDAFPMICLRLIVSVGRALRTECRQHVILTHGMLNFSLLKVI